MDEYYIRTPDRDESRGPFTPEQLLSLAEAEQVDINTLYFDDFKEEWIPIAANPELKEKVFPVREKLKLKVENTEEALKEEEKQSKKKTPKTKEKAQSTIANMLAVAENETKGVRRKRKRETSMERALFLSTNGLCLIMLLSAISILIPHLKVIKEIATETSSPFLKLLNYPLILLGFLDLSLSVYTYFGDQKLNPILRARAMLAFGFGIYIGWALNDFYILSASAAFGIGILWTTLTRRFLFSIPAVALGFGGSAALAYLALSGNLNGVMEILHFEFFTSK